MDGHSSRNLLDSAALGPAWRWQRATHLRESGREPDPRIDDDWVVDARDLLAGARPGSRPPRMVLRGDVLDAAYRLWVEKPSEQRWELEARLLTGMTIDDISDRCAIESAVVRTYAHLFFDVRGRLGASDWILTRAIECGPFNGFGGPQPGGSWKYVAYFSGPLALDVVLAATTGRDFPSWVTERFGRNPEYQDARLRLLVRLWLLLKTATSDAAAAEAVVIRERLRKLDARAAEKDEQESYLSVMEQFLRTVAGPTSRKRSPRRTQSVVRAASGPVKTIMERSPQ